MIKTKMQNRQQKHEPRRTGYNFKKSVNIVDRQKVIYPQLLNINCFERQIRSRAEHKQLNDKDWKFAKRRENNNRRERLMGLFGKLDREGANRLSISNFDMSRLSDAEMGLIRPILLLLRANPQCELSFLQFVNWMQ